MNFPTLGHFDADQLRRRLASVLRLVSSRQGPIMACINVDRDKMPILADGTSMPEPTIAHTLGGCESCTDAVWIGPAQRAHGGIVICYICAAMLSAVIETETYALNPDIDNVPTRNAGGRR